MSIKKFTAVFLLSIIMINSFSVIYAGPVVADFETAESAEPGEPADDFVVSGAGAEAEQDETDEQDAENVQEAEDTLPVNPIRISGSSYISDKNSTDINNADANRHLEVTLEVQQVSNTYGSFKSFGTGGNPASSASNFLYEGDYALFHLKIKDSFSNLGGAGVASKPINAYVYMSDGFNADAGNYTMDPLPYDDTGVLTYSEFFADEIYNYKISSHLGKSLIYGAWMNGAEYTSNSAGKENTGLPAYPTSDTGYADSPTPTSGNYTFSAITYTDIAQNTSGEFDFYWLVKVKELTEDKRAFVYVKTTDSDDSTLLENEIYFPVCDKDSVSDAGVSTEIHVLGDNNEYTADNVIGGVVDGAKLGYVWELHNKTFQPLHIDDLDYYLDFTSPYSGDNALNAEMNNKYITERANTFKGTGVCTASEHHLGATGLRNIDLPDTIPYWKEYPLSDVPAIDYKIKIEGGSDAGQHLVWENMSTTVIPPRTTLILEYWVTVDGSAWLKHNSYQDDINISEIPQDVDITYHLGKDPVQSRLHGSAQSLHSGRVNITFNFDKIAGYGSAYFNLFKKVGERYEPQLENPYTLAGITTTAPITGVDFNLARYNAKQSDIFCIKQTDSSGNLLQDGEMYGPYMVTYLNNNEYTVSDVVKYKNDTVDNLYTWYTFKIVDKYRESPVFKLVKAVSADTARKGDTLQYTITVTNNGGDAVQVHVQDKLDSHLQYATADNSGAYTDSSRIVEWIFPSIKKGESKTMHLSAKVI